MLNRLFLILSILKLEITFTNELLIQKLVYQFDSEPNIRVIH